MNSLTGAALAMFFELFTVMKSIFIITVLLLGVISVSTSASGEKCTDIKGTEKWNPTGHGDNKPSEKKFKKMLEGTATICEISEKIDHMEVKGVVKDWTDFEETFVYQGASEEQQMCLKERFDLPDDGDKALQAYEIKDCGVGDY